MSQDCIAKVRDNSTEQLERVLPLRSLIMQFQSHGKHICFEKFLVFKRATFCEELNGCLYGSYYYIWFSIPDSQPTGQIGRQKKISRTYNIRLKSSASLPLETKADPDREVATRHRKL